MPHFLFTLSSFLLGNNNKHIGNEKLRKVARTKADLYKTASKKEKSDISRGLVTHIRNLDPPGRFLKRDPTNRCWHDVGDEAAREKASQALRDALGELDRPHRDETFPPLNPTQKYPRPLKVPSLPNSYRCSYEYDNDYKRRRMSFEEGLVDHRSCHKPINAPPRMMPPQGREHTLVANTVTTNNNYGQHSHPSAHSQYYASHPTMNHTPVVTPDDPQHWRDLYSATKETFEYNYPHSPHPAFEYMIQDHGCRPSSCEVNEVSIDETHDSDPATCYVKNETHLTHSIDDSFASTEMSTLTKNSTGPAYVDKQEEDMSFDELEDLFKW